MTSTFYIQKDQEETFKKFVSNCNKKNKSYSSVLVELMKKFNQEKDDQQG
jgi:hypothetical protein